MERETKIGESTTYDFRLHDVSEDDLQQRLASNELTDSLMKKMTYARLPRPTRNRFRLQKFTKALGAHGNEDGSSNLKSTQWFNKRRELRAPPKDSAIPAILKRIVISLGLLDEPSLVARRHIFIGYCKYHNYSYGTTMKYFNLLVRTNVLAKRQNVGALDSEIEQTIGEGDDAGENPADIYPKKLSFIDNGALHTRIVAQNDFKRFVRYLHDNLSVYSAPLLLAAYTGLRSTEILQMTTYNLYQLSKQQPQISIKRKQTALINYRDNQVVAPNYWEPVYNTYLISFILQLKKLFADEYEAFMTHQTNINLFVVTPKTLANRMRLSFYKALGFRPPHGFGIHSCRNMIAMIMAEETHNVVSIQQFLQHKNLKTTRRYIKADIAYTAREFDRLTKYEFSHIANALVQVPSSNMDDRTVLCD